MAAVALAAAEAKDREEAREKQKAEKKRSADDPAAASAQEGGRGDEHREGAGDAGDDVCLTEQERALLEVLHLRCKTHLLLFTDDAFQFNQQIAELRKTIDAMIASSTEAQEDEDEEEEDEEDSEYEGPGQGKEAASVPSAVQNVGEQLQNGEGKKGADEEANVSSSRQSVPPSTCGVGGDSAGGRDRKGHTSSDVSPLRESGDSAVPRNVKSEHSDASGTDSQGSLAPSDGTSERASETLHSSEKGGAEGEKGPSLVCPVKTEVEEPDGATAAPAGAEFDEPLEVKWPLPLKKSELRNLLHCFLMECLATVFSYRNHPWARASIEQLFQHIYLHRSILSAGDQGQTGLWQAQLKAPQKAATNVTALSIGEASVPIQDGRDERISTVHGSIIWSAKQMGC